MADAEIVCFISQGVKCRGWLYNGGRAANGNQPGVVISHGISGTHCSHYWRVAEAFAAAGYATLDFDPRYVGASEGRPRQRWSPSELRQDLEAAVGFLRTVPGVDPNKIGLYGSSTGGGGAIEVAAADRSIAALICFVPHVDGLTNFPGLSLRRKLALTGAGIRDLAARALRREQVTIPAFGYDSSGVGAVDRDGALVTLESELQPGGEWDSNRTSYTTDETTWTNAVAPWDALKWLVYRPGRKLDQVTCPTLLVSGDYDTVTPPGPQRRLAASNPCIEVLTGPWNHFDAFRADRAFPELANRMTTFLKTAFA